MYKRQGLHSLSWTFNPGAVLSIKKDLKFEKKDPTGKDTYLSAFLVWVYNEQAQDKKIEFEFLKDGKKCTSFPFGINITGWRAAWVCYERDMVGTPEEMCIRDRLSTVWQPERISSHFSISLHPVLHFSIHVSSFL